MDDFLELVAEEIEFPANEILRDMQNKKRRPARPIHYPLEMCWNFRLGEKFRETGLFRSYTNFITTIAQKQKILKLNHLYPYDIQNDHILTVF